MTLPAPTFRADVSGTAFGGAPTWTDYTGKLELGGDGQPIAISWGRQDERADTTASTCSFTLDNTTGMFSPGNAAASAGWDVDTRVNIRLTRNATVYDRFDGYIDSIEPTWPGGVQSWAIVRVSCSDVTARLGRAHALRSFYEQEVLSDNPAYFYPCSEPSGATAAGNIAATARPAAPVTVGKYGGSGTFGGPPLIADTPTTVTFAASGRMGAALAVPNVLTTAPYTIECVFQATATGQLAVLFTTNRRDGSFSSQLSISSSLGDIDFTVQDDTVNAGVGTNVQTGVGGYNYQDGKPHHVLAGIDADSMTVRLFVDGVAATSHNFSTVLIAKQAAASAYSGASIPVVGTYAYGLNGSLGMVAVYPGVAPTLAMAQRHYNAAKGWLAERSDVRFARVAAYGGVPTSSLPVGQAMMGAQQVSGRTAIDVLREVARTEGAPSYATGSGLLTFEARNARYNAPVGLSVTNEDVDAALTPRTNNASTINDYTVTRQGGAAQRAQDGASINKRGTYNGSGQVASATDFDALQNASWTVTTHKTPASRIPSVKLDLLTQQSDAFVQAVLAARISTLVRVTGLPAQAPTAATSLFVEGGTESIGVGQWSVEFFTSPNLPGTLRADAAPSAFTKLDSGLKIPF